MVKKLIKTKKDYDDALACIEELMDAKQGTSEADELELLVTLVELYEESQYPIQRPDPVEAIKFRIDQLGMNRQDLIPFIGSRSKVSEILNKKKPLSLSMMRALNKGLGIPAEVLLQEPESSFPFDFPQLEWNRFPLKEMAKRGLIDNIKDIKTRAEEYMRRIIQQAGGPKTVSAMLFRKSKSARQNVKTDKYALWAWRLQTIILARHIRLKQNYSKGSLTIEVFRDIAKLSYFENGPVLAKEYLNKLGIIFLTVLHFPKTYLDGASFLLEDGTPVIALTLRHDRIDNFWFCLLHELGHVALHLSKKNDFIIDDMDLRGHKAEIADKRELDADRLAEEALVPKDEINKTFQAGRISSAKIDAVANKLKIHPAILAGKIRYESRNCRLLSKYVGQGKIREQFHEYKTK
jgi:HTH-type transcriptional regulator/antitoxin HigA